MTYFCVGEISNMGCTPEAIDLFIEHKKMYAHRVKQSTQAVLPHPAGNVSKRHAPQLECRRSGRKTPCNHARHPCTMREIRHGARRIH